MMASSAAQAGRLAGAGVARGKQPARLQPRPIKHAGVGFGVAPGGPAVAGRRNNAPPRLGRTRVPAAGEPKIGLSPFFSRPPGSSTQTRKSESPARRPPAGPRFPFPGNPGRIGNRGLPVSPPFPDSGESGIGGAAAGSPRFPKRPGNRGDRKSDFLSDEHQPQWTQHTLSREFHALTGSMRLLFRVRVRVRGREHAAVICLP
jgi:hypothetical protein